MVPPLRQFRAKCRDRARGKKYSRSDRLTSPSFLANQVAKLVASSCTATLTAFISPYLADRALARKIHEESKIPFLEVFVDAPLAEVEKRDPKGLYAKARAGTIKGELARPTCGREGGTRR